MREALQCGYTLFHEQLLMGWKGGQKLGKKNIGGLMMWGLEEVMWMCLSQTQNMNIIVCYINMHSEHLLWGCLSIIR